jgi:hypothetical protein
MKLIKLLLISNTVIWYILVKTFFHLAQHLKEHRDSFYNFNQRLTSWSWTNFTSAAKTAECRRYPPQWPHLCQPNCQVCVDNPDDDKSKTLYAQDVVKAV